MKKKKAIIIKNPLLRNLRNNLRKAILDVYHSEWNKLLDEGDFYRKKAFLTESEEKEYEILSIKFKTLERAKNHSICICPVCSKTDKDMIYNTKTQEWYCLDCYNELPKSMTPDWTPEYPLSPDQVAAFFHELKRFAHKCRTDFGISRRILRLMNVNNRDQDKFLDICKEYGGYCDCEILMNAHQYIKPYYYNRGQFVPPSW